MDRPRWVSPSQPGDWWTDAEAEDGRAPGDAYRTPPLAAPRNVAVCGRCGDPIRGDDVAEVGDGELIHQSCMEPGEEIS